VGAEPATGRRIGWLLTQDATAIGGSPRPAPSDIGAPCSRSPSAVPAPPLAGGLAQPSKCVEWKGTEAANTGPGCGVCGGTSARDKRSCSGSESPQGIEGEGHRPNHPAKEGENLSNPQQRACLQPDVFVAVKTKPAITTASCPKRVQTGASEAACKLRHRLAAPLKQRLVVAQIQIAGIGDASGRR